MTRRNDRLVAEYLREAGRRDLMRCESGLGCYNQELKKARISSFVSPDNPVAGIFDKLQ
jgi:hypothetical protein